jgi:hypothetical protein
MQNLNVWNLFLFTIRANRMGSASLQQINGWNCRVTIRRLLHKSQKAVLRNVEGIATRGRSERGLMLDVSNCC